ncbi:MAG: hypothetical protein JST32_10635 [Bacteroidetes bacterium]|nr:hypothetical protein [Bacteroidota bacterium]
MNTLKIEAQLSRINNLLEQIAAKLGIEITTETAVKDARVKPSKPTAAQLRDSRAVEFANKHDRRQFLKVIKEKINDILEIRKHNPGWHPEFTPQSFKFFSKFRNSSGPFYQQLKKDNELFAEAVTEEGRRLIEKSEAIG